MTGGARTGASERRYRAIFDSSPYAVLVADLDDRFIDANAAAVSLLRAPRDEILAQECEDVFVRLDTPCVHLREMIVRGERPGDVEATVMKPGCECVRVLVTASPFLTRECEVKGIIYTLREMASVKHVNQKLRHRASTDELTGLLNRWELARGMEAKLRSARRHERTLVVFMIDLDDFKRYNDGNGHLAGDESLREVGGILAAGSRKEDIVARYGGDEFVIVLSEAAPAEAMVRAERIRCEIASRPFPGGKMTASIGVFHWKPSSPMQATETLKCVDQALYQAKRAGKNRVVLYSSTE